MNVQKFTEEINKRSYILDVLNPEILSTISRQSMKKFGNSQATEIRSIFSEASTRK
jgi:hypothetical protein